MSHKSFITTLLICSCSVVVADRALNRTEILSLFNELTDNPVRTWIPSGTIRASHQQFDSINGFVSDSTVQLNYDGDHFYWEVNIESYEKISSIYGKSHTNDIDLKMNKRRVYVWDGQRYTMYFATGKHAIVNENTSDIPVAVNGPLTAGLVPWGYGILEYNQLLSVEVSAIEKEVDGRKQIHLMLNSTSIPQMTFVLDPEKDYAVLKHTSMQIGSTSVVTLLEDYEKVSDIWIPRSITIERYDNSTQTAKLLTYNHWNLTHVNVSFTQSIPSVTYESNTLIEYRTSNLNKSLLYRYRPDFDTECLLQYKIDFANNEDGNCATAAIQYIAGQFSKKIPDDKLLDLVAGPNNETSLYQLRQLTRDLGLSCTAIETNIDMLRNLHGQKAILYLASAKHFVILEHIDNIQVWLIDLKDRNFYYPMDIKRFLENWSGGIALLVSDNTLSMETPAEISDEQLRSILGSDSGGFGNYSCTDLIQEYDVAFCSPMVLGTCGGVYEMWYERYGCELTEEAGTCTGTGIVGSVYSYCIADMWNPGDCTTTGEYISKYIRACQ